MKLTSDSKHNHPKLELDQAFVELYSIDARINIHHWQNISAASEEAKRAEEESEGPDFLSPAFSKENPKIMAEVQGQVAFLEE